MSKLTEAVFSMQCSFIAKNAAAWAGDLLTLPEYYNHEADPITVARFTDDMRGRLDRLDEWVGREKGGADLLNAAKAMIARWPNDQAPDGPLYDEAQALRTAIAKAEGF